MSYRLRQLPRFPANISGANGLVVDRDGVDLVASLDYEQLVQVPSVIDPDTSFFALWNRDQDSYLRMSFNDVFNAVSGLGFMQTAIYDPTGIEDDAFNRDNHYGTNTPSDGTVTTAKIAALAVTPEKQSGEHFRSLINGLFLSNNGSDATNNIDIAAGAAGSDGATPVLMTLANAITKRTNAAWAVGSGNGGWLDGASMPNGTGHAFLIQRSDTGVVDVGFSASLSPTLPTNYDRKAYIAPIVRASGAIRGFKQVSRNKFIWSSPVTDRNSTSAASSALLAMTVPTGVEVMPLAYLRNVTNASTNVEYFVGSAVAGSANLSASYLSSASAYTDTSQIPSVLTNTSGQIYFACTIAAGSVGASTLVTYGWELQR